MGFASTRWTNKAALLEVVKCPDDAFYIMLSVVKILGRVLRDEIVQVGEAEVRVQVIPCDVVFVVEGAFGHWAFFVEGYGYSIIFAFDAGNLFDSAGVCFIFQALVSVAHLASPVIGTGFAKMDINIVSYELLYSIHVQTKQYPANSQNKQVRHTEDVQAFFFSRSGEHCGIKLSQETVSPQEPITEIAKREPKPNTKPALSVQALVDSLKSASDDIGQITELTSEEKLIVAEFFKSFLRLMHPLASAVPVNTAALPGAAFVVQAHIDPTGHLAMLFGDGHMELKDLAEEGNRDLMIAVAADVLPKFKNLTAAQKRKVEERVEFLSSVTKELQKMSEALAAGSA